jgi:hypothetical protein
MASKTRPDVVIIDHGGCGTKVGRLAGEMIRLADLGKAVVIVELINEDDDGPRDENTLQRPVDPGVLATIIMERKKLLEAVAR